MKFPNMNLLVRLYSAALYRLASLFTWRGLARFLEDEYTRIPSGAKVLAVGAGGRFNTILYPHAKKRGFTLLSLDIDPNRGPDIIGDLCLCPFLEGSFDVVVVGEVLEHVHSPRLAVDSIYRVLASGGSLVLTTPFIFPIHDRPRDYFRFTRFGLAFLLKDFRDVRITARSSWAESINALSVRLALEGGIGARLFSPFMMLVAILLFPVAWLAGKLIKTDFITLGYLVSAKK
jgi:SAM-dependent methyltransferase